jgi:hypothetical protein
MLEWIDEHISELETRLPSYSVVERLADLYTVRSYICEMTDEPEPASTMTKEVESNSDFMARVKKLGIDNSLKIIDDFVDELKIIHPKIYHSLMDELEV